MHNFIVGEITGGKTYDRFCNADFLPSAGFFDD